MLVLAFDLFNMIDIARACYFGRNKMFACQSEAGPRKMSVAEKADLKMRDLDKDCSPRKKSNGAE